MNDTGHISDTTDTIDITMTMATMATNFTVEDAHNRVLDVDELPAL